MDGPVDGPVDGPDGDSRDDREELLGYVEVWWRAVGDLVALLERLRSPEWALPTDLPGWDVRACAAHCAHLETVLAGGPDETADIGEPAHVVGPMGRFTEVGVVNRRTATPTEIVAELREATTRRHDHLLGDPPTDADGAPDPSFPGVGWTWRTLLRNRPLDVWMHEQDIRRATGRVGPAGHLDSAAARHTVAYLADGLGFVLAKRAGAPAGTSLLLRLDDGDTRAFVVDERGRGVRLAEPPATPSVTLDMDREALVRLAGGRGAPAPDAVAVTGDADLGRRVLDRMAITP